MSRDVCGICWCPYDDDGKCGCKPAQPEALRLADELEKEGDSWFRERDEEAAAELRRLHAENEALRCQKLQAVADQADQMTMDEALLRQALEALEYYRSGEDYQPTPASEGIIAIKERLK